MKTKTSVHIRIEHEVYLFLRSQNINISSLANELLKSYVENENIEIPEEVEVLKQLELSKHQITEHKEKISQLSIMLAKIREDKKEQEKQDEEIKKDQHDLMRQMLSAQERGNL